MRARNGQLNLNYTYEYGIEKATKLPAYVDAQRYMQLTNELRWNDNGNNANEYPTYAKDLIDNYAQLHAENPDEYPDTDWRGLILRNSAAVYYNEYKILDSLGNFNTSQVAWNFNSTNTFTLPKDFKLELSGWFEAPNVYGIWRSKAMWSVNFGVQKSILKKKGTLKVNVNDIFASQRFRGVAEFNNIYLNVNNRWQNRTLNLAFTYRFGNTKMETKERQTGTDESRRAGN